LKQRIPNKFSKEYLNEFDGIARIRVDAGRTWKVNVRFDYSNRCSFLQVGWSLFNKENNLQVGGVCKFEMTESKPLSFNISITRANEEPSPNKLQGFSFILHYFFVSFFYKFFFVFCY